LRGDELVGGDRLTVGHRAEIGVLEAADAPQVGG
jgi:hypothetical protein